MKKFLTIVLLALWCSSAFAQQDTTAIFKKFQEQMDEADYQGLFGDFDEAIKLYDKAIETAKSVNNGYNMHYVDALLSVGDMFYFVGDNPTALKYFLPALEVIEKLLGKDDPKYAETMFSVGYSYYHDKEYQTALKYYMELLDIYKKNIGTKNLEYAETLHSIGILYLEMDNYKEGLTYLLQYANIQKKTLGKKESTIAQIFDSPELKELLQTDSKTPTQDPDYASTLDEIAYAYSGLGDYRSALKCYKQSMDIRKKVLGVDNPNYATSLTNMGIAYSDLGDYQNSLKYLLQALKMKEKNLQERDPAYASLLSDIGYLYNEAGDFQNALKYTMKSLEIRQQMLDYHIAIKHPDVTLGDSYRDAISRSYNNLGIIYSGMGDYKTAFKYYSLALEIMKQKSIQTDEDISYATSVDNLGSCYKNLEDYKNAILCYKKAMEIRKRLLGEEHPNYAYSLSHIGTIYELMKDYQNALKYHTQALEIRKKVLGTKHPDYSSSLAQLGNIYDDMGDYQNALKYHKQAMEIYKKVYGEKHTYYAVSLSNIGFVYNNMGDYQNAIKTNKLATEIHKDNLIRNFSFMTAHEREAYWDEMNDLFTRNIQYMSHLPNDTMATKTAYNTEIIAKGLLLASEINIANVIMESGNQSLIDEFENLKDMHLQLNRELERPADERVYNCDSLEDEIKKIERHVMESCKEFGDVTNFLKIDWKTIQNSMKANDVAIEFANYKESDTTKFVALVLTKGMNAPVCVPLFTENDIKKLQRGVAPSKLEEQKEDENRGAFGVSSKRQGIYESTGLYNILWKPLEKYFPENPRIYFAPSGMLHQVAIEYAPTGDGKLISDKYEIYRVSSTRFLALDYMPKQMKSTVLYGGVYYDSDTTTMKKESKRYSTRNTGYSSFAAFNAGEERGSLNYLPGTKTEVEDIIGKLKKNKIKTTLYEGSQANEESFKALSGSDITTLHIATHGFFLPTDEKLPGDQALIQSGLLLSGANYAWQNLPLPEDIEDGILTAKEISFMDLRKTDLVVLSACQTALGEITGEGVFGLQRGFKKAGARTIIMSLWPVDDNATLLMMTEFYNNLTSGMSKREAFLAAQNTVKKTKGFENSRYWAAFIMLDGNE